MYIHACLVASSNRNCRGLVREVIIDMVIEEARHTRVPVPRAASINFL